MSFAGVIVFELGYDGETLRQHEFTGLTFDQVLTLTSEEAKQWRIDIVQQNIRLRDEIERLKMQKDRVD